MRLPCLVTRMPWYKCVNMTTGICKSKSKRRAEMSNNQSIRKKKIIKNFDFSSCRGDNVTWRATGARVVARVYALWHITMCARHVSQLLSIILWFINLFETKYWYTSATLVSGSRLWTDAPAMNRCVKWHHLTASFSAWFLIGWWKRTGGQVQNQSRDLINFIHR